MELLDDMSGCAVRPDVISCSTLLMECEQHRLVDREVELLSSLGSSSELRAAATNAACVRLLAHDRAAEVCVLLLHAAKLGHYNKASQCLWEACKHLAPLGVESGPIVSKTHSGLPSTHGGLGGTSYNKELRLMRRVFQEAKPGDAASVCMVMERFGEDVSGNSNLWLKLAGGAKARTPPPPGV